MRAAADNVLKNPISLNGGTMQAGTLLLTYALLTSRLGQADPLATAKDLYTAAAYEDALSALNQLAESDRLPASVTLELDEYRAFCLLALGRTSDAEAIAEQMLRKAPEFELSSSDTSPRVQDLFNKVRRQLLPTLIRDEYRLGKAAVQEKDFSGAEKRFLRVRQMVGDADHLGVKDDSLVDLSVLADGFLDLARSSLATPPTRSATTTESPPVSTTAPPDDQPQSAQDVSFTLQPAQASGIVPPVPVREVLPPVPPTLVSPLNKKTGVLDVTVDTDGHVAHAVMRESLDAAYDQLVVFAARQWRYKPALKGGVPVKYVRTITLELPGR